MWVDIQLKTYSILLELFVTPTPTQWEHDHA